MTSHSQADAAQVRWEIAFNWLALLALLALGVVAA